MGNKRAQLTTSDVKHRSDFDLAANTAQPTTSDVKYRSDFDLAANIAQHTTSDVKYRSDFDLTANTAQPTTSDVKYRSDFDLAANIAQPTTSDVKHRSGFDLATNTAQPSQAASLSIGYRVSNKATYNPNTTHVITRSGSTKAGSVRKAVHDEYRDDHSEDGLAHKHKKPRLSLDTTSFADHNGSMNNPQSLYITSTPSSSNSKRVSQELESARGAGRSKSMRAFRDRDNTIDAGRREFMRPNNNTRITRSAGRSDYMRDARDADATLDANHTELMRPTHALKATRGAGRKESPKGTQDEDDTHADQTRVEAEEIKPLVDPKQWHIFRDHTGFNYRVVLHRTDNENFEHSGEYILYIFESKSTPRFYKTAGRLIIDGKLKGLWEPKLHGEPTLEAAFREFNELFHNKTMISWDQRCDGIPAKPGKFGRGTPSIYFPPSNGAPVGELPPNWKSPEEKLAKSKKEKEEKKVREEKLVERIRKAFRESDSSGLVQVLYEEAELAEKRMKEEWKARGTRGE